MKNLRNKFEVKVFNQLKRAKSLCSYESEKIPYVLARHYIPDFIVTTPTGKLYIETKGQLRRDDRSKMVAVKKQHPNLDIRILFYSRNKSYIKWAERYGFRWAVERIPDDWLKGL